MKQIRENLIELANVGLMLGITEICLCSFSKNHLRLSFCSMFVLQNKFSQLINILEFLKSCDCRQNYSNVGYGLLELKDVLFCAYFCGVLVH